MRSWSETKLAHELWTRQSAKLEQTILDVVMPTIETVLTSGASASLDFTLHDHEHGFRVAERSSELLGGSCKNVSNVDLTLLLLASYCHDIGMSPSRKKIKDHLAYLVTGERSLISKAEYDEFQAWLDTNRAGLTAPIDPDRITATGLKIADDAVAYYARSKHNDWTEDYIRSELSALPINLYAGWIHDLVMLCRSHHEGLSELRQDRFDAKNVGSPSQVINPRYLAAVLRVADILEFAPERTPAVILKYRDIAPSSRIYWYKDHSISFTIDANFKMILSAQTPSAYIHKAVLDTAESVDDELALCALLEQENAFIRGVVLEEARSVYKWPWPSRLITDIRELPGRFTYIPGNFRPDTQKVLSLLSGTAIYEQPVVAVRELIQNALDAVREQIAYTRLAAPEPSDPHLIAALEQIHSVTLSLSFDGKHYWLSCADDGSGMTRPIIEKHLLVSGSGIRGETRRLSRAAQEAGFSVERTGRFGIGVLSYFMIAERLKIVTRRSQEAGDTDGTAWSFSTQGLDGFGELCRESRASKGTTVQLRLRSDILDNDAEAWFATLVTFVRTTFRWLPCRLVVRNDINTVDQIVLGPSWTESPDQRNGELLEAMFRHQHGTLDVRTQAEIAKAVQIEAENSALICWARDRLRWTDAVETNVPESHGQSRGALPFFALEGGASSLLFDVRSFPVIAPISDKWGRALENHNFVSLHGVNVQESRLPIRDSLVDLDLRGAEQIMVDRTKLVGARIKSLLKATAPIRLQIWNEFLEANKSSIYNEINISVSPLKLKEAALLVRNAPGWLVRSMTDAMPSIEQIVFPIVSVARVSFYDWTSYHFRSLNAVSEAVPVDLGGGKSIRFHLLYGGGRVVHHKTGSGSGMVGIEWSGSDDLSPLDGSVRSARSRFPYTWKDICAIIVEGRLIYNSDHFLTNQILSYPTRPPANPDLSKIDEMTSEAAGNAQHALKFIVNCLRLPLRSLTWLRENRRSEVLGIFRSAGITAGDRILVLDATYIGTRPRLVDISAAFYADEMVVSEQPGVPAEDELEAIEQQGH